jgi:uncharacterized protein YbaR (Trm112 family)
MDHCPYCDANVNVVERFKDGGTMVCPLCSQYFHCHPGTISACDLCWHSVPKLINELDVGKVCPECNLLTMKEMYSSETQTYLCSRCDTNYF